MYLSVCQFTYYPSIIYLSISINQSVNSFQFSSCLFSIDQVSYSEPKAIEMSYKYMYINKFNKIY
jgi:hypothetical protein